MIHLALAAALAFGAEPAQPKPYVVDLAKLVGNPSAAPGAKPPPAASAAPASLNPIVAYARRRPGERPGSQRKPLQEVILVTLSQAEVEASGRRQARPRGWLRHFYADGVSPAPAVVKRGTLEWLTVSVSASAKRGVGYVGSPVVVPELASKDSSKQLESRVLTQGDRLTASVAFVHKTTLLVGPFQNYKLWWPFAGPVKVRIGDDVVTVRQDQVLIAPPGAEESVGFIVERLPARLLEITCDSKVSL